MPCRNFVMAINPCAEVNRFQVLLCVFVELAECPKKKHKLKGNQCLVQQISHSGEAANYSGHTPTCCCRHIYEHASYCWSPASLS